MHIRANWFERIFKDVLRWNNVSRYSAKNGEMWWGMQHNTINTMSRRNCKYLVLYVLKWQLFGFICTKNVFLYDKWQSSNWIIFMTSCNFTTVHISISCSSSYANILVNPLPLSSNYKKKYFCLFKHLDIFLQLSRSNDLTLYCKFWW